MNTACRSLSTLRILGMLLLVCAALAAGAAASAWSTEQAGVAAPDDVGAYADEAAYGIDRPDGPGGFMQPVPVALGALHENVSRGHWHLYANFSLSNAGSVLSSHVAGRSRAGEAPASDIEGRHRHRWLQTYRC